MASHCQTMRYSSSALHIRFTAPNGRFAFVLRLQITIMPKQLLLTSICTSCLQQGTFICSIYFPSHFGLEGFLNKSITVDVGTGLLNNTQADYTHYERMEKIITIIQVKKKKKKHTSGVSYLSKSKEKFFPILARPFALLSM